eukprot:g23905.t1
MRSNEEKLDESTRLLNQPVDIVPNYEGFDSFEDGNETQHVVPRKSRKAWVLIVGLVLLACVATGMIVAKRGDIFKARWLATEAGGESLVDVGKEAGKGKNKGKDQDPGGGKGKKDQAAVLAQELEEFTVTVLGRPGDGLEQSLLVTLAAASNISSELKSAFSSVFHGCMT